MTTLKDIRLTSQQLVNHKFNNPLDLVTWMGAIQAQDFGMAKWAIAIRTKDSSEQDIEDAFNRGDFLRTHVMRPTWHFVPAEDIKWMLKLTEKKIASAVNTLARKIKIDEEDYKKSHRLLEKALRDNNHLTKEEVYATFEQSGFLNNPQHMYCYMMRAETDGIICSGILKDKKHTYALLDERVSKSVEISREEALAKLAQRYMLSHSPASLNDFVWWSGLSITDAKKAITSIESELFKFTFNKDELYVHQSYQDCKISENDIFHLLPAYDEYVISYKNRTDVLDLDHHPKAFNNFGIFQPIMLHNGHVVGNWKKIKRAKRTDLDTTFWEQEHLSNNDKLALAKEKLQNYIK